MQTRLAKLDILRILAVVLVLGRHLSIVYPAGLITEENPFFVLWRRFGWTGVDLFFVLSGFLVSGLLFSEYKKYGSIDLLRFFVRRGFKIYPAFYFLIAFSVFLRIVPEKMSLPGILNEIFFIQNYFPGIWNHTWSLAVEEHFYALIGLFLLLLSRKNDADPFRHMPVFLAVCTMSVLLMRIYVAMTQPYSHVTHLFPTHLRIDALFLGVFLSYCNYFKSNELKSLTKQHRGLIAGLSSFFILPCFLWDVEATFFIHTFGLTFLYLGFGGLLLIVLGSPGMERLVSHGIFGWLASLGACSYSIYLWHMPVRVWQEQLIRHCGVQVPPVVQAAVYIISCMGVGLLMAKVVEMPFLKLRDHFFPSRSKMLHDLKGVG